MVMQLDNKCGIVTVPLKFGLTMKEFTDAIIKPFGDAENGVKHADGNIRHCESCGNPLDDDQRKCFICGQKVRKK